MMDFLSTYLPYFFQYGAYVIAAASVVSQMTPNTTDDNILKYVVKAFNFLALNWGTDKAPVVK